MKRLTKFVRGRLYARRSRPRVYYPHGKQYRGTLTVGEGSILGRVDIDCTGDVSIGARCILSDGIKIFTHSHVFLEGFVPDITAEKGINVARLRIGDNAYVGEDSMILPQVGEIGDSAIIGARAVLTRKVGPREIWAGNPARKVGERPAEHSLPRKTRDDGAA